MPTCRGRHDNPDDYFTGVRAGMAPDAGHFVLYETPDPTTREIAAFFATLCG